MISNSDFQKIKMLIFDIDGTLTDGKISYDEQGNVIKFFNIQDQHWLKLLVRAGLQSALLSGRDDPINRHFAAGALISRAVYGAKNKCEAFQKLCEEAGVSPEECLYAGDDVVDMPVLRRAGIAVIPANAVAVMDEVASWRTAAAGGEGAVQEIICRVLREKGMLDQLMERYRQ